MAALPYLFYLALGIIALPVPEETLMVLSGFLMSQGTLRIAPTILAATLGSICGITVSYLVGKTAGYYFLHKHGSWLGLTEDRLDKAHEWFTKFGKWALLIGYFIPGVRHFTGLSAGTTRLDYSLFATFAYLGAFCGFLYSFPRLFLWQLWTLLPQKIWKSVGKK